MSVILFVMCVAVFAAIPVKTAERVNGSVLQVYNGNISPLIPYQVSIQYDYMERCVEGIVSPGLVDKFLDFFTGSSDQSEKTAIKHYAEHEKHRHICSGTVIGAQHILSAAHCFYDEDVKRDPAKFSVVIGANNLRNGTKFQRYCIAFTEIHKDYSYRTRIFENDIAIAQLKRRIEPAIEPLKLPNKFAVPATNIPLKVAGWGATKLKKKQPMHEEPREEEPREEEPKEEEPREEEPSDELRAITLQASECPIMTDINTNTKICGVSPARNTALCRGDSGSPLTMESLVGNTKTTEFLGVYSMSSGCEEDSILAHEFFTRVSPYSEWITEKMNAANPNSKA